MAPELALQATDAGGLAANLSVRWSALPSGSLWARVRHTSLSSSDGAVRLPNAPEGTRTRWSMEVGVVMRNP